MFFFIYDAKYKDILPYWDKFPLVIPIEMYDNGFLGLNLHYLPIPKRKVLIKYLLKYKTIKSSREYLKISYSILNSASKMPAFKECIHRYLMSHLRSRFVKVDDFNWEKAAALPVQKFQKKSPY
jgi:hypothetical protein